MTRFHDANPAQMRSSHLSMGRTCALLLCLFSFLLPTTTSATEPEDSLMKVEADSFLARLPKGMQHRQTLAVLKAIEGDNKALNEVRHSRNAVAPVSEDVTVRMLTQTLRLYEPKDCKGKKLPLLIYLHGGGWTFGSLNSCARFCDALVTQGGLKVMAVDYRLAPEHPFPTGLYDCIAAVKYARSHADSLDIDTARVSVGGDSSGGNLAIATSLSGECRGLIHSLLLFYPVTKAFDDHTHSWKNYAEGYGLDAELMEAFNNAYCQAASPRDPRISIGLCSTDSLAHLPQTLLVAAGRDILRDQGMEFANRVPKSVKRIEFPEAVHLFITVPGQDAAFHRAVGLSHEFLVGKGH